jgi:acyl dehydratase
VTALVVAGLAEVLELPIGQRLGASDWVTITQDTINAFADATGDHQWIHVDPERAKDGPFGTTVAHGYLTLSLVPRLLPEIVRFDGFAFTVNYGCERVRFPSPVPVGSRVRAGVAVQRITEVDGGVQLALDITFELRDVAKPACVATILIRHYT